MHHLFISLCHVLVHCDVSHNSFCLMMKLNGVGAECDITKTLKCILVVYYVMGMNVVESTLNCISGVSEMGCVLLVST